MGWVSWAGVGRLGLVCWILRFGVGMLGLVSGLVYWVWCVGIGASGLVIWGEGWSWWADVGLVDWGCFVTSHSAARARWGFHPTQYLSSSFSSFIYCLFSLNSCDAHPNYLFTQMRVRGLQTNPLSDFVGRHKPLSFPGWE